MRYLGLDVGSKNIGVAVGEQLSSELTTLKAAKDQDFYSDNGYRDALAEIEKLLELEEADAIVIGLPVNEDGRHTEESKKIESFSKKLEGDLDIKIHAVDETLTSFMAEDMLEAQGLDKGEVAKRIHQASASLILQQYLEENESI